jgi:hypothetical protein
MLPMMATRAMRLSVLVGMTGYLVDEMKGKLEMPRCFFGFVSATKKPQMGQWGNDVSALFAEDEGCSHVTSSLGTPISGPSSLETMARMHAINIVGPLPS